MERKEMGYGNPDVYYNPEAFDLEVIDDIQWGEACYDFDVTGVWRRKSDGQLFVGDDSGCSCYSPFERFTIEDLTPMESAMAVQKHLESKLEYLRDGELEQARMDIANLMAKVVGLS
jgi:hypothetical protein